MALYVYLKKPVSQPSLFSRGISFLPLILIILGLTIISWVGYPIISFELFQSPKFTSLVRPIPDEVIVQAMENEEKVLAAETEKVDYTKASNWFPQKPPEVTEAQEKQYTLSIPKLGIENILVTIGGEDLNHSLVHYGGTALPGDWGKAVVFGHSVLPAFFNPQNYKTIFSTLPELEKKDQILINYDGIIYTYEVFDLRVVPADDISVLEQKYDSSYLSLVTCVPPGTYWKRLIVMARLKEL